MLRLVLGGYRRVSFRPESGLRDGAARTLSLSLSLSLRTRVDSVDHTGRLRPAGRGSRALSGDGGMKRRRAIISRSKESRFQRFAIRNSVNHLSDALRNTSLFANV